MVVCSTSAPSNSAPLFERLYTLTNHASDIQGIAWGNTSAYHSRARHRRSRIIRYDSFGIEDGLKRAILPDVCAALCSVFRSRTLLYFQYSYLYIYMSIVITIEQDQADATIDDALFYRFRQNSRTPACSLWHFQLRHCIKATSNTDVYHAQSSDKVYHWNVSAWDVKNRRHGVHTKVIDLSEDDANNHDRNMDETIAGASRSPALISTLSALDSIVCVGCIRGEFAVKNVLTDEMLYNAPITTHDNAISNYIDLTSQYHGSRSMRAGNSLRCIVSQNDSVLREFRISTSRMHLVRETHLPWSINHATLDPTGKMICALGDEDDGILIDADSGKRIAALKGHLDFPFSSHWNPVHAHYLATGAQDRTTRIWDTRMLNTGGETAGRLSHRGGGSRCNVKTLRGCLGAVRCVKFSSDGQLLCASEAADFVHVYSAQDSYEREQLMEVFGEIVGIDLSPDASSLFVGIFDTNLKSIIEFNAVRRSNIDDILV